MISTVTTTAPVRTVRPATSRAPRSCRPMIRANIASLTGQPPMPVRAAKYALENDAASPVPIASATASERPQIQPAAGPNPSRT